MKRPVLALVLLALGLGGIPAAAAAAPPRAAAKIGVCRSALEQKDRIVSVVARMRPYRTTKRFAIRVEPFYRKPNGRFAAVPAFGFGFGFWRSLPRTTGRYVLVANPTDEAATYRFRVGFRWIGRHGKVERTMSRVTGTCRLRDLRPDLRIGAIRVIHGRNGHDRYSLAVRNTGATDAGPFTLLLSFPDGTTQSWDVAGLAAGAGATRTLFGGPACADGAPTATADSGAVVEESNEQNNTRVAACPAP